MRQSFIDYVDRMKKVRSLSTPSLESISTASDYSRILLENFKLIGQLAKENRETVEKELLPLLQSERCLSEEEKEELEELNNNLFDVHNLEEIDQHIADMINERHFQEELSDAEAENYDEKMIEGLGKTLQIKYFLMSITGERNLEAAEKYRAEGLESLKKLMTYLEKERFEKLPAEVQTEVFGNCLSGVLLYEMNRLSPNLEQGKKSLEHLKRMLSMMKGPLLKNMDEEYLINAEYMIYYYMATLAEVPELPVEMAKEIFKYCPRMLELWDEHSEVFEKRYTSHSETSIKAQLLQVAMFAEDSSMWERYEELYQAYAARNTADFGNVGMFMNVDLPEILYRALCWKKKQGKTLTEQDVTRMGEFVKNMLAYLHHMPKNGGLLNGVLEFARLLNEYQEFPGYLSYEELCVQMLAAVHPPTFIHSNMVAKLTFCLTRHLLQRKPELFVNFPGTGSRETVLAKQDEILSYAYHAALCHDIGKTTIIDTIGMYGRFLLDSEYFDLKQHPDNGAAMAKMHGSTKEYVDVIRGHHLWYDGSKGYPMEFDAAKSPYKVIIDLVTAADCLDAATDSVGRSYNKGKTLADFGKELAEGAGTRYAPYLPELFADPDVHQDLEYLLSERRSRLYQDTFHLLRQMTE